MTTNHNKIDKFWTELKRRGVIKVVAIYAPAAFILLELMDIITSALTLPSWIIPLLIIVLAIGFPVIVILSWIFDLTPEGIKKTDQFQALDLVSLNKPVRRSLKISDVVIAILLIVVFILAYPKIFQKKSFNDVRDAEGRITIAVMPFENLTGDTTMNWFQRGISSLIINALGGSSDLAVRDDHTMYDAIESLDQVFTASLGPAMAREVAEITRSETYISGSFQGRDDKYRIVANLINTETGEIIWTNHAEGNLKSSHYLDLVDTLCDEMKNYLEIKALEEEADYDFRDAYTESAEAYRYFIEGMNLLLTPLNERNAIQSLSQALDIDSTFTFASFYTAWAYNYFYQPDKARFWTEKTYQHKDHLPVEYQYWLERWYATYISKNMQDINMYSNLMEKARIESRFYWFDLGVAYYSHLRNFDKALSAFEKVEEINKERGGDWEYEFFYDRYGLVCYHAGKHEKEKELYETGLDIFPEGVFILWRKAISDLSQGDTAVANNSIDKIVTIYKNNGFSETSIEHNLGNLYHEANLPEKAELHLRNAIKLSPENKYVLYNLARLLIYNDIHIEEGMELIEEALVIEPNNVYFEHLKGWGLYKQGKLEESLNLLKKAEEFYPIFDFDLHQQIREVEMAIAN